MIIPASSRPTGINVRFADRCSSYFPSLHRLRARTISLRRSRTWNHKYDHCGFRLWSSFQTLASVPPHHARHQVFLSASSYKDVGFGVCVTSSVLTEAEGVLQKKMTFGLQLSNIAKPHNVKDIRLLFVIEIRLETARHLVACPSKPFPLFTVLVALTSIALASKLNTVNIRLRYYLF